MSELLLVDFDYTLFNTRKFFDDIFQLLEKNGHDTMALREDEHLRGQRPPGPYSLFEHLRSEGFKVEAIKEEIVAELAGREYVYGDVTDFLQRHNRETYQIVILTVGTLEYQEFKVLFAPSVVAYPRIIAAESKTTYLQEHLKVEKKGTLCLLPDKLCATRVTLIDDRVGTFEGMPKFPNLDFIRLRRPDGRDTDLTTPAGITEVTSLSEVRLPI